MTQQKFTRGDLVHIAGPDMSHFDNNRDAIVIGSYADQFGARDSHSLKSYTVMFTDTGYECSWYMEHQLTFLAHVGASAIEALTAQRKTREDTESKLPWIVEHWNGEPSTASCEALMRAVGITNPWGRHGEGLCWHSNWQLTLTALQSALATKDMREVQARIAAVQPILSTHHYH